MKPLSKAAALLVTLVAATFSTTTTAQEKPTASADPAPWVQKRVLLWQPAADERRFDDIGWAKDILEARRLAKEQNRPIFLFTHDGHMAVGRC